MNTKTRETLIKRSVKQNFRSRDFEGVILGFVRTTVLEPQIQETFELCSTKLQMEEAYKSKNLKATVGYISYIILACQELQLELAKSQGAYKARIGQGQKWLYSYKGGNVETARLQLAEVLKMSRVCYQTEPGSAHLLSSDWLLVRSQGDFQEYSSSTFCFQPVSGLCACCHHVVTILHLAGGLVSAKQLKDMHQIVIYNFSEGTRIPVSVLSLNYCSNCHYWF